VRAYAVGVDVGGTKLSGGLVDRKGRMVREHIVTTPLESPFAIVDSIIEVIRVVTEGTHPSELAGIGLGLPAQIDWRRQTIEFCTNLPLAGIDVRGIVKSRLNMPVIIDNDGEVAAIGEARFGAAQGVRDFLIVVIGTGIGGGLYLDGKPYRGSRGFGGEIGHILVEFDGLQCPCGGYGHLEAYSGRLALVREGRAAAETYRGAAIKAAAHDDLDAVTDHTLINLALTGDEAARGVLDKATSIFGRAMVGMVNLLDPELLLIGGGLGVKWPGYIDAAREAIQREALAGRADVRVEYAELGNAAGVIGAAALAFDEDDSREGQTL
jgi:glucokinase